MCDIMAVMGYLTESQSDRALVLDMWNALKGDDHEGVTPMSLKTFMAAISNFTLSWMKPDEGMEVEKKKGAMVGFNEGRAYVTERNIHKISSHFSNL